MQEPYIWTRNGLRIHLDPCEEDYAHWDVETVAHCLGQVSRWTGHVARDRGYSVAQHSVIVSYLTPSEYALEGLFHDAPEFILGDISTPVKRFLGEEALQEYKRLTHAWDATFATRFGLRNLNSEPVKTSVKIADRLAQYYEGRFLLNVPEVELRMFSRETPGYGDWGTKGSIYLSQLPAPIERMLDPLEAYAAEKAFLRRFKELKK